MAQLLPRFLEDELERERQRAERMKAGVEAGIVAPGTTAAGDRERLRGVPVIARCIRGAVKGTHPVGALLTEEARQRG